MAKAVKQEVLDMIEDIRIQLRNIQEMEDFTDFELEIVSGLAKGSIRNVKNKRNFDVISLMKMISPMGYKIILVKEKKAIRKEDSEEYMIRYKNRKQSNRNGYIKRKFGEQAREDGAVVRVKQVTDPIAFSRRKQVESAESEQDDFLSIT